MLKTLATWLWLPHGHWVFLIWIFWPLNVWRLLNRSQPGPQLLKIGRKNSFALIFCTGLFLIYGVAALATAGYAKDQLGAWTVNWTIAFIILLLVLLGISVIKGESLAIHERGLVGGGCFIPWERIESYQLSDDVLRIVISNKNRVKQWKVYPGMKTAIDTLLKKQISSGRH